MKPKTHIKALVKIIILIAPFLGCSRAERTSYSSNFPPEIIATNTQGISDLARFYAQNYYRPEVSPIYRSFDAIYFFDKHRDEILNTFQVAEVTTMSNSAVAFTRFSIGGTIYHQTIWFSKYDGRWLIKYSQFVDELNLQNLKNENPYSAKMIAKKADKWKKDGADLWFW